MTDFRKMDDLELWRLLALEFPHQPEFLVDVLANAPMAERALFELVRRKRIATITELQ